jgi:NaMN:DMB phosphoribosyltransferase
MANIFVNIEKGVEIGAEDALKWLTSATQALSVTPSVVAALGTLFGQLETPITDVASVVTNPLNVSLDVQTVTALKNVWPEIQTFLTSIGVKL